MSDTRPRATSDIPSMSAPGIHMAGVVERRRLCREHFALELRADRFPTASPGQFVQILCCDPSMNDSAAPRAAVDEPLLRRPFSIGGLVREGLSARIEIVGRVIGSGTRWLSERAPGDSIELLGPLGRPFHVTRETSRAVLVAGGVGLPPIAWLATRLAGFSFETVVFFGAGTRDFIPLNLTYEPRKDGTPTPCIERFSALGIHSALSTDDGSCGFRGRVTDPFERYMNPYTDARDVRVYACGPEPMLKAVAGLCNEWGIECEVAMERVMACGIGTCQSCVVRVRDSSAIHGRRFALCCTEGPVFSAQQVIW